jgi:quinol monooxygenase YgiN
MVRKVCGALLFAVLTAAGGLAQQQGGYLDVFVVKVRPEKWAEFDAVGKKLVDANRRHNGDLWLALAETYGEQNTIAFTSTRESYDAVEKSSEIFGAAMTKAFGEAGATALYQQFNNTIASARGEFRQRRWDLSYNPPADQAAYLQTLAKTRWIRSVFVRVRPGYAEEFEAEMKELAAASQKSNQPGMRWISQVVMGGNPGTYVISRLLTSLSELDQAASLKDMLGEEGYEKFQKMETESVAGADYVLYRVLPELSNPPAEVIAAAPDFWNPKPKPAAPAKPKS